MADYARSLRQGGRYRRARIRRRLQRWRRARRNASDLQATLRVYPGARLLLEVVCEIAGVSVDEIVETEACRFLIQGGRAVLVLPTKEPR